MNNQKTARIGENLAVTYLISHHYLIIERNVRFIEGEIDIIAKKQNQLIFVEVKTRTNHYYGYPEQSMDRRKKTRFKKAIDRYIVKINYQGDFTADLITIDLYKNKAKLRHYKSIELED